MIIIPRAHLAVSEGADPDLFDCDWDNAPGPFPACSFPDLTDNYVGGGLGWVDYGPGSTCSGSPQAARIVTDDLCPGGTHTLETSFPTGGGTQGLDFRIERQLTNTNTNIGPDVYIRFYVKWSSNFYWLQSDQKVVIWGGYHGGITGQDYYFQTRGLAGNRTAKVVLYTANCDQSGDDGFVRATNVTIYPDVWYRWEVWAHYGSGTSGAIRCRVDGVDLTWTYEAGSGGGLTWDPHATDNSNFGGVKMIKPDGTYNGYNDSALQSWIGSNGTMYKKYGRIAAGTQGWIGAAA